MSANVDNPKAVLEQVLLDLRVMQVGLLRTDSSLAKSAQSVGGELKRLLDIVQPLVASELARREAAQAELYPRVFGSLEEAIGVLQRVSIILSGAVVTAGPEPEA